VTSGCRIEVQIDGGGKRAIEGRTSQGAAWWAAWPLGHSEMHEDRNERIGQPLDGKGVSA
jgi:hypothetical protein